MNTLNDRTVVIGVVNPKGEPDDKKTTYLTESELDSFVQTVNDRRRKPYYIHLNHYTHDKDGKPAIPCGQLINAVKKKENGKIYVAALLYDNDNGRLADKLVRDKKIPMRNFSLGYNVYFKDKNGEVDVFHKQPLEVSLCYRGARENTDISTVTTFKDLIDKGTNKGNNIKYNNDEKNKYKSLINKQNLHKTRPKEFLSGRFSKYKVNMSASMINDRQLSSFEVPMNCTIGYKDEAISKIPCFSDLLNRTMNEIPDTDTNIRVVNANAAYDTDSTPTQNSSEPNPVDSYNSNQGNERMDIESTKSQTDPVTQSIIDGYKARKDVLNETEIKTYLDQIKKSLSSDNKRDVNFNIPITEPSLSVKCQRELDEFRKNRKPIPENTDPDTRAVLEEYYRDKEARLIEEHKQLLEKEMNVRNTIQKSLNEMLPDIVKASNGNFTEKDYQALAELYSRAPELGAPVADGVINYMKADASRHAAIKERDRISADKLEKSFQDFQTLKEKFGQQYNHMEDLQNQIRQLKQENESLKNSVPVGNYRSQNSMSNNSNSNSTEPYIKKVKANASNDDAKTYNNIIENNSGFDRWGKVAMATSRLVHPTSPPSFWMEQGRMYDNLYKNHANGVMDHAAYIRGMQERYKKSFKT